MQTGEAGEAGEAGEVIWFNGNQISFQRGGQTGADFSKDIHVCMIAASSVTVPDYAII